MLMLQNKLLQDIKYKSTSSTIARVSEVHGELRNLPNWKTFLLTLFTDISTNDSTILFCLLNQESSPYHPEQPQGQINTWETACSFNCLEPAIIHSLTPWSVI